MKRPISSIPKNFDDLLEALVNTLKQQSQPVSGLNLEEFEQDLANQRAERQQDIELTAKAKSFHTEFSANQSNRFIRFQKAIKVLRAINSDHPEVLTALSVFKRTCRKTAAKQNPQTSVNAA